MKTALLKKNWAFLAEFESERGKTVVISTVLQLVQFLKKGNRIAWKWVIK